MPSGPETTTAQRTERWLLRVAAATGGVQLAALLLAPALPPTGAGRGAAAVALLAFWLAGPGALAAGLVRLPVATKLALAPLLGLCLLLATSVLGAWSGVWAPRTVTAGLALLTAVGAAAGLRRFPPAGRRSGWRPSVPAVAHAAALLVAVGLWTLSLPALAAADPSVAGLVVAGPWTFPASVALATAALVAGLHRGSALAAGASAGVLVLLLRGTAAATTTVPLYAWTYKHLGVVDSLLEARRTLPGTDIYQNWPAMFSAGAWFSEVSGVAPIDVAPWTTPVVHVVLALQVAALARALGARRDGCVAAAALVVPLDWVGQDYYAPQAVGILLATGVLVLLVQSRRSPAAAGLAVLVFAVLVPTHQLTPFWLLGTALVLAVLRRAPWWVAALFAVLALAYLATRLDVVGGRALFSGFDFFANAAGNVPESDATGRRLAAAFARASAVLVWGTTLGVLLHRARRRGWRGRHGWRRLLATRSLAVPAVVAFSAFGLLGGQSYGGEAILRVVLYTAPGCAAVLGPALAGLARAGGRRAGAALGWGVLTVALTTQAHYGAWFVNLVHLEDVVATTTLLEQVSPPATIRPVLPVAPDRATAAYVRLAAQDRDYDASLSSYGYADVAYEQPGDLRRLSDDLTAGREQPVYLVFTAAMRQYDAFYGVFPPGGYENLRTGLEGDPSWTRVLHDGDTWVYQYTHPGWPTR